MPLSVRMSVDPALAVIAAAPMTTHNSGVMSSIEEEDAVSEEGDKDAVEPESDAPQHVDEYEYCRAEAAHSRSNNRAEYDQGFGANDCDEPAAMYDVCTAGGIEKDQHRKAEIDKHEPDDERE